ncbi:MAG: ORF6N domain-containing protein [Candidatus Omnitrophota bacterium]|nr:ORF6N domain-containing protein [Candidatus Omnitrophota bacterium]
MGKLVKQEVVRQKIFVIRGKKVMLSVHLALLYGVEVRTLIQAVKRNIERLPSDFMFQLTWQETESLRSQIVTLNGKEAKIPRSQFVILESGKNIKYLPYAFTEQGIAMLSSVLRSKKAIQVNIAIMRAFVKLREILSEHKELAQQVKEHGKILGEHGRHITAIYQVIDELMAPREKPKRKIGFRP